MTDSRCKNFAGMVRGTTSHYRSVSRSTTTGEKLPVGPLLVVHTIQQASNSSRKGLLDRAPTLEPISVRRRLLRKTSSQTTEPCPLVEGMSVSSSVSPSRCPWRPARSQILALCGVPSCDRREETCSSTHCVNEIVGPLTVDETSMLMQKTTPDSVVRHMSSGEIVEALLSPGPAWFAIAKWPHAA